MDVTVSIRAANNRDLAGILEIARSVKWLSHLVPATGDAPAMSDHLAQSIDDDNRCVLVAAEADGIVAGYSSAHLQPYLAFPGKECYVAELFVAPQFRGKGVGADLLRHIEQWAADNNCYRLMLINGRERQSYRRRFYAKNGWQERPEVANFIKLLNGGGA